ncbi:tRNA modification GTPase [Lacinutrix chionoecetis]
MKKNFTFLLILVLTNYAFAQTNFEKGYYVNNAGDTINCLIKNSDWKDNPTDFEYKIQESDVPKTMDIVLVKAFVITNISKYIRAKVDIDRSSDDLDKLTNNRAPAFKEESLFLEVLIEGDANLYFYEDGNLTRFFFNLQNSDIEQLVYKSYLRDTKVIAENDYYQQQLLNSLTCQTKNYKKPKNLEYKKNDLIKVFKDYNLCTNSEITNYNEKKKRKLFYLRGKAGVAYTSLQVTNPSSEFRNVSFNSKLSLRLGLEAEFVLPFNNNKWSLFTEPGFQNYTTTKHVVNEEVVGIFNNFNVDVNFKTFEFPIGVRHYFFLNNHSKLFVNGAYKLKFTGNSNIKYSTGAVLEIKNANTYEFGLGYNYKNKWSIECRYALTSNILGNYQTYLSTYKNSSVIIGYNIL